MGVAGTTTIEGSFVNPMVNPLDSPRNKGVLVKGREKPLLNVEEFCGGGSGIYSRCQSASSLAGREPGQSCLSYSRREQPIVVIVLFLFPSTPVLDLIKESHSWGK